MQYKLRNSATTNSTNRFF